MASTTETGHAKNVATFEDLISYCNGYGAMYNPSKNLLQPGSLRVQLTAAQVALQSVKETKTVYDNATNAREIAFKPLKPLAVRIISALSATDAAQQTINDVRTVINRIQGRRATPKRVSEIINGEGGEEPVRTFSVSQQSFDKMIDHFSHLVTILAAEPNYRPNEDELKVSNLNTRIADLRAKNRDVVNAHAALSNARIGRDRTLYGNATGILDIAHAVKLYVKSLFGLSSAEFKQVRQLSFSRIGRN